jgi:glycosyltransferase involved in cell wall biosynthesis
MAESSAAQIPKRIFYATGPGDAIGAHRSWKCGAHHPTETSVTFSSQVEQYCADIGADLLMVGHHPQRAVLTDGKVRIEHLPKPWPGARGGLFHLGELVHAARLLTRAIQFKADVAIIESGSPFDAWKVLFSFFGMKVVPICHNTLWPQGFKPKTAKARLRRWIDGFFWRHVPFATICVSPACVRQVEESSGGGAGQVLLALAQFPQERFRDIPPPPAAEQGPFTVLYVGRIVQEKGVFDIIDIAALVEAEAPGAFRWIVGGDGPDLHELRRRRDDFGLGRTVDIRGWISPEELPATLAAAHACIVPTRSSFPEGLPMTAVEAVLAGRPVITSKVVPALELVRSAVVEYETDDLKSCARAIIALAEDELRYRRLCSNARSAAAPFVDPRFGLTSALKRALGAAPRSATDTMNLSNTSIPGPRAGARAFDPPLGARGKATPLSASAEESH